MLSKFHVLLVEDNADKHQLLKVALEIAGYEVHSANDGITALAIIEARPIDLIVTDTDMPRMDGYEMVRRVRANPSTRFIPVIIQTAIRGDAQDVRLGAEAGALGYITDPTDLDLLLARARTLLDFKNYLDSCEEAAFTDELTGLSNRRRFFSQLAREVSYVERHGGTFCLLVVDVDHFKKVNDQFGHPIGDEVLIRMAGPLSQIKRRQDLAARIGGEEFAVILRGVNLARGAEIGERLRAAVEGLEIPTVGRVTVSVGVAEYPSCGSDKVALYSAADQAVYAAKEQGRNRVRTAPFGQVVSLKSKA